MQLLQRVTKTYRESGVSGVATKSLRYPVNFIYRPLLSLYNRVVRTQAYSPPTDLPELREIDAKAGTRTDISDHLQTLFVEALQAKPSTIVELGVRGGESTYVLERVARLTGANLVSVDIEDCSDAGRHSQWKFVRSDDVEFAARFPAWCSQNGVDPRIGVLFLDTSHEFRHTVNEIAAWFPHLSEDAVVLFHDTNMRKLYRRRDRTLGKGWDNRRGVIRAIEDYLGCTLKESESFVTIHSGYIISHNPLCNGMTILKKCRPLNVLDRR